ncbi:MAG: 30S ribosomal protein S13 [candidate division WOR-3 bacterium]|nr:30S ribosomal protein S13 [candidate division WOR-3 bacterium]
MARISGVDLPNTKRVEIALTYIFGIGHTSSLKILEKIDVDKSKKVNELNDDEIEKIRKEIDENYKVEGTLKASIKEDIKRLKEINCYRGQRHRKGLPVRGQRTKTNARTRKGPSRGSIALKKQVTK